MPPTPPPAGGDALYSLLLLALIIGPVGVVVVLVNVPRQGAGLTSGGRLGLLIGGALVALTVAMVVIAAVGFVVRRSRSGRPADR